MLVDSLADEHKLELIEEFVDLENFKLCAAHVFSYCLLVLGLDRTANNEVFHVIELGDGYGFYVD